MKLKIIGVSKAQAFLKAKELEVESNAKSGIKQAGEFLKEEVRASIRGERAEPKSVDTGDFANSITIAQSDYEVSVYSPLDYPKFLEYGTSKIKARRHFGNSLDRSRAEIIEKVKP